MKISDLLGAVLQSGMTPSSNDRMKNSMGGGSVLDKLAGMFGGGASGGRPEDALSDLGGGGSAGGLGLHPEVTQRIREVVGLHSA
jgi:hypothetical protein